MTASPQRLPPSSRPRPSIAKSPRPTRRGSASSPALSADDTDVSRAVLGHVSASRSARRASALKRPRRVGAGPPDEESGGACRDRLVDRVPDCEAGWMLDCPGHDPNVVAQHIVVRLKSERLPVDSGHEVLADGTLFEELPELDLDEVDAKLAACAYTTLEAFDRDLHRAFLQAERAFAPLSDRLGQLFLLKRLYHELTYHDGSAFLGDAIPIGAARGLASVGIGPGSRRPQEEQVKLRAKDKVPLEGVQHKGEHIRVGDWVHLMNPDHPSRPIIAQVFSTYRRVDTGRRAINVCWYYRPEDTVHHISRVFMKDEVFKTGNFIDHLVEDILGRCLVLFYTKYLRGRPAPPAWTPDMPTYICEHRYKDENCGFKKIKNWESCVPSNIRSDGTEENFNAYPTPQAASNLVKFKSPFLRPLNQAVTGNGEPIVMSPEETLKDLPKDQLKAHDFNLTLAEIAQVMGEVPMSKARLPLVHGSNADDTAAGTPAAGRGAAGPSRSLVSTLAGYSTPMSSPSLSHSLINSSVGHFASQIPRGSVSKPLDLSSPSLRELLKDSLNNECLRRRPYWLDVWAAQEYFEKLPAEVLALDHAVTGKQGRRGRRGTRGVVTLHQVTLEDASHKKEVRDGREVDSITRPIDCGCSKDGQQTDPAPDRGHQMMWFPAPRLRKRKEGFSRVAESDEGSSDDDSDEDEDEHESCDGKETRSGHMDDEANTTTTSRKEARKKLKEIRRSCAPVRHSQAYLDFLRQNRKGQKLANGVDGVS